MIYLDYASNHPVRKEVLDEFVQVESTYEGNCNSIHGLGRESLAFFHEIEDRMYHLLNLDKEEYEVIYTSSASESNNMVIKGLFESYTGYSTNFLSSPFEHSSVNAALAYLKDKGADVLLLSSYPKGKLDLSDLKEKLKNRPILTCVSMVESETGAIQDVHTIQKIVSEAGGYLLVDATQALGKIPFALDGLDFVSFGPHKFGGILGTGVLVKRRDIVLAPLIHGGKSLSIYRSSSPALGLIASTIKATELALKDEKENYDYVKSLSSYLVSELEKNPHVLINSFLENPFVVNISYLGEKAFDVVSYLDRNGICVSQKSACSITNTPSKVINSIYHDKKRASSSFRISLSALTTKEELMTFLKILGEYHK